jgi:Ca2+-binding RTX toxin-like protein
MAGGAGDDLVLGRKGDDALDGNEGDNTLDGGSGFNTCVNGPVFINLPGALMLRHAVACSVLGARR